MSPRLKRLKKNDYKKEGIKTNTIEVIEAINTAITLEQDGQNYYFNQAKRTKDTNLREIFMMLGTEETYHKKELERLKASLTKDNEYISLDEQEMKKNVTVFPKDLPETIGSLEDRDVLMEAILMEEKSEQGYLDLAKKVQTQQGKAFFEALAAFEKEHSDKLNMLLDRLD